MLYPKNSEALSLELFKNPTKEYRATPFWAWNNKLDEKELMWQMEQLKKLGFGGVHIHVRTGLATTYLSDEFMELVKSCVEKARHDDMLVWLYDEDRWPSGAAGGYVTKNPEYRIRHLLLTRISYHDFISIGNNLDSSARSSRTGNGKLLACYDVFLTDEGTLKSYTRISEEDIAVGFKLYAYEESAMESPWYNNQTYADTLNPKAIQKFIKVTYERYKEYVGDDFGELVPAIFTDEPQFSHKGNLDYAHEEKDVFFPWTGDFPDTYHKTYSEDILNSLPELLWELPDDKISKTRYSYHDHISERFSSAFADQCGKWCEENGIMLTGHMMEEPTLKSQTAALGEAMRSYRGFQLPGIDMLSDSREFTTAKQAQSAARQFGRPGVMSELYGVTNWDFDFRGHKLQGDWQAALGVTVRVPHLAWVSMNGEAKRDYPSTFNYQSPWYDKYPYIEDHFARVNTAMTRGKADCSIGVIHPIESYWLYWGTKENTEFKRSIMDRNFQNLTDWLLEGLLDFDYISESLFPMQCNISDITQETLPVGEMQYQVILVPPVETLRTSTLERLTAFMDKGGKVIFLGEPPKLADALPSNKGKKAWEMASKVPFDILSISNALKDIKKISIRDIGGNPTDNLIYQLRKEDDCQWLFVAHRDKPINPDIPAEDMADYRVSLKGEYSVELYDTITGNVIPVQSSIKNGLTTTKHKIYEHDSLLLRYVKMSDKPSSINADKECAPQRKACVGESHFFSPVPVTLHEPNVLLLDICEYALNDAAYELQEEILRLDNGLRKKLGWPLRGEAVAQPWVDTNSDTPHTLKLRFHIESRIAIDGAMLALEHADITKVTLNGQSAGSVNGWYVDKSIQKVSLPQIVSGTNCLEMELPYGKKINVEACYLIGDFGVEVMGCNTLLTEPIRKLPFGDISRMGLPFYGGNLTYHLEVETKGDTLEIEASYYRSHLLNVFVDGKDCGIVAFSPYKLMVGNLSPGKHSVDIICFGTRVNTFGQLHRNDRINPWWGPNSWRSTGASWTQEYRFWEQGILKSPEIRDL